jgi:hypothetical protein
MTLVWKPGYSFDSDASTYIDAVETADGQALETGVRVAINNFVLGCKQDEIWDAINACCILAGARTLDGALVPLVGTAPTNNNFVSGDYNRTTGLKGNGSTKYLDSNRPGNASPTGSIHASVHVLTALSSGAYFGERTNVGGSNRNSAILIENSGDLLASVQDGYRTIGASTAIGFIGIGRSNTSIEQARIGQVTSSASTSALGAGSNNITIFAQNAFGTVGSYSDARLAFYSIGESLDLAALDTRVSNLITAIGAAIP